MQCLNNRRPRHIFQTLLLIEEFYSSSQFLCWINVLIKDSGIRHSHESLAHWNWKSCLISFGLQAYNFLKMHGKSTSMLQGSSKQTGVLLGNCKWYDKKKRTCLHKLPAMILSKEMAICVWYLNTEIRTVSLHLLLKFLKGT